MAFPSSEDFESYANLDSWSGLNGGTGWSAGWDLFDPEGGSNITNTQAQAGTLSGRSYSDSGGAFGVRRDYSNTTTGTFSCYIRRDTTSGPITILSLGEGATMRCQVRMNAGNFEVNNDGTWDNISAHNANQWYQVEIDIVSTTAYRVRIDGGTYTANKTIVGGSFTNLNRFQLESTQVAGATQSYLDTITSSGGAAVVPASNLPLLGVG